MAAIDLTDEILIDLTNYTREMREETARAWARDRIRREHEALGSYQRILWLTPEGM